MPLNVLSRAAGALAILAMFMVPISVGAECVRWKPMPPSPDEATVLHGPGSYGVLDRTVTLDCLSYVGSIEKEGREHVLIRDERGEVHVLKLFDSMGQNRGRIDQIDDDFIYISQVISRDPAWRERDYPPYVSEAIERHYGNDTWVVRVVKFPKRVP